MKTIIAGSRNRTDVEEIERWLDLLKDDITEVVCGMARGVDTIGKEWADKNNIPVKKFPADWNNVKDKPDYEVSYTKYGKPYWKKAGLQRNIEMAKYAEQLIAFWDGESSGTKHMITEAETRGLKVIVFNQKGL